MEVEAGMKMEGGGLCIQTLSANPQGRVSSGVVGGWEGVGWGSSGWWCWGGVGWGGGCGGGVGIALELKILQVFKINLHTFFPSA